MRRLLYASLLSLFLLVPVYADGVMETGPGVAPPPPATTNSSTTQDTFTLDGCAGVVEVLLGL